MVTVLMTMIYFIQYLPFNRCQHCHECRYKYFEHQIKIEDSEA